VDDISTSSSPYKALQMTVLAGAYALTIIAAGFSLLAGTSRFGGGSPTAVQWQWHLHEHVMSTQYCHLYQLWCAAWEASCSPQLTQQCLLDLP
jgi:hypothetical protein